MKKSANFSLIFGIFELLVGFFVFGLIFDGCSFEKKPGKIITDTNPPAATLQPVAPAPLPPPPTATPAPADKGSPGTAAPGGTTGPNTTMPERDSGF